MTIYATLETDGQFQIATQNHANVYTFTDCKKYEDIIKINNITKIDFYKKIITGEHMFSINDYIENREQNQQRPLNERMIEYRGKNHLTQTEFAKLCKISTPTITNIEISKSAPTAITLYKIEKILNEE